MKEFDKDELNDEELADIDEQRAIVEKAVVHLKAITDETEGAVFTMGIIMTTRGPVFGVFGTSRRYADMAGEMGEHLAISLAQFLRAKGAFTEIPKIGKEILEFPGGRDDNPFAHGEAEDIDV